MVLWNWVLPGKFAIYGNHGPFVDDKPDDLPIYPESEQTCFILVFEKAVACSRLQPLAQAATCSHFCSHLLKLPVCKLAQVAASGCVWLQVAPGQVSASGCEWLQVAARGCLRKWLQVVASGCKWLLGAACGCLGLQVAASSCKWLQVIAAVCSESYNHLQLCAILKNMHFRPVNFHFFSRLSVVEGYSSHPAAATRPSRLKHRHKRLFRQKKVSEGQTVCVWGSTLTCSQRTYDYLLSNFCCFYLFLIMV